MGADGGRNSEDDSGTARLDASFFASACADAFTLATVLSVAGSTGAGSATGGSTTGAGAGTTGATATASTAAAGAALADLRVGVVFLVETLAIKI